MYRRMYGLGLSGMALACAPAAASAQYLRPCAVVTSHTASHFPAAVDSGGAGRAKGAVAGAAVGAGVGVVLVYAISRGGNEANFSALALGRIVVPVAALIGAAIGASTSSK